MKRKTLRREREREKKREKKQNGSEMLKRNKLQNEKFEKRKKILVLDEKHKLLTANSKPSHIFTSL